jgi:hypothetical protein
MLWIPFWNIIWRRGSNVYYRIRHVFNKNYKISTHIELVSKPIHIPDLSITKLVPKQHVEPICVLGVNLAILPNIVKQHLLSRTRKNTKTKVKGKV